MSWIRLNEVWPVKIEVKRDLVLDAKSIEIHVMKPNGESAVWIADGVEDRKNDPRSVDVVYDTCVGDANVVGRYTLYLEIMGSDGKITKLDRRDLDVKED